MCSICVRNDSPPNARQVIDQLQEEAQARDAFSNMQIK